MGQKWIRTGVLILLSLLLAHCTPWYELDDYQMYRANPQSVEIRQNPVQAVKNEFQEFVGEEQTRIEIQQDEQLNLTPGKKSEIVLVNQSNNPVPISPEEELELIVSQFTSRGRPVPAQVIKNIPSLFDEANASVYQGNGNYLESIAVAPEGGGSRFLIKLNQLPEYRVNIIDEPNHFRIYIDFYNTQLALSSKKINVNSGSIYQIRSGQFNENTARVVFDARSETKYKIYKDQLKNSLVVEFQPAGWQEAAPTRGGDQLFSVSRAAKQEFSEIGVVQELGLKIRRIIIDPGHGGRAPGAVGPTGLKEKDVVFSISRWLQKFLIESGKYDVVLTRESDREMPLEERTRFANEQQGDLFISIHVNANKQPYLNGVETYYLSLAKDNESRGVAAFENQSARSEFSNLDQLLTRILKKSKVKESAQLAQTVQQHLVGRTQLLDRGVRHAGFVVLIGAQMPAILVEAGYISNPVEEQMMRQSDYHRRVAQAIFEGIQNYSQQTTVLAEQVQSLW